MKPKFCIILAGLLALTACKQELLFLPETFQSPVAECLGDQTEVSMVFSPEAGSATLSFQSSQAWTASFVNDRAREWCSIPVAGGRKGTATLQVDVKKNEGYDERSASILLICGEVRRTLVVTQKQQDALLLSPGLVELPQEGGTFSIELKSNIDYQLTMPGEFSWLHQESTKGLITATVTFRADANDNVLPRYATVLVSSSLGREGVAVFQHGEDPALVLGSRSVEMPAGGGTFEVQITSNLDVEITGEPESCDWVEEVKTKTLSTQTYCFSVSANEAGEIREMDLVFSNAQFELSDSVHVRQAAYQPGFSFSTSQKEVTVPVLQTTGAWVYWGDGAFDSYSEGLKHSYKDAGRHSIRIEGQITVPLKVTDLEDGMVIDFSGLKEKEVAE